MLAIEYNFPVEAWEMTSRDFPLAYEVGLEREPSPLAAPPENICQLIQRRPMPWPRKKELDRWPGASP
jgi:hypothetical protein